MVVKQIPKQPKILVVGGGAREHAIVWKLAQSPLQPRLYAAPGNPGIAQLATCWDIPANRVEELTKAAQSEQIDLIVVGPEQPLELGLADLCQQLGIPVFGPSQAAAKLETSKAFSKDLMQEAGVPTASYRVFANAQEAKQYATEQGAPIVVKADGLAAGKGVTVAMTLDEALAAIDDIMLEKRFGDAGARVVLESYLEGPEVSLMFFVDGDTVVPMIPARDHKRAYDHDEGPNTGGMGAFAPVPSFVEADLTERVEREIVQPTLAALKERGVVYRGVLYAGLMITAKGPYVIEFNARFGDPETEVVLPLLKSDLLEIMWAAATGSLADETIEWHDRAAVCVVLAAPGYPQKPVTGSPIEFHSLPDDIVFHAGTAYASEPVDADDADKLKGPVENHPEHNTQRKLITAGGRVLTIVGRGQDMEEARRVAYKAAERIQFDGQHMRTDIGARWRE